MADRTYLLRTEASYFPWGNLTEPQQLAIEGVAGFLKHSADILDAKKDNSKSSAPDPRYSRLAFVDADRGMGKTTVLAMLQKLVMEGDSSIPTSGEAFSNVRWLNQNWKRFKWLTHLDMEPLPVYTNLLAAILVRIGKLLAPSESGSFLQQLDARSSVTQKFNQLKQHAVTAWDGVSPQRIASLDPPYAATEVIDSEEVALDLNSRLADLLLEVARVLGDTGTIFIVPIDDVDLTPTRCLELLRIVRMLSTPRLFFVIVGNASNAEEMLRLQCEGELAGLAGAMATSKTSDRIRSTAAVISSNHLRKLVPPHQRIHLRLPSVDEALAFKLPGWSDGKKTDPKNLNSILEKIKLRVNYLPESASKSPNKISLLDQLSPYTLRTYLAREWIIGSPRHLLDRAESLLPFTRSRVKAEEELQTRRLLSVIAIDVRNCLLNNSSDLDSGSLDAIQSIVQEHPSGTQIMFRENFSTEVLRRQVRYSATLRDPAVVGTSDGSKELTSLFLHNVEWIVNYPAEVLWRAKNSRAILDSRSAGALTFLHDLSQSVRVYGGLPEPIFGDDLDLNPPAVTRWRLQETILDIPWMLPSWRTFREVDRFWLALQGSGKFAIPLHHDFDYQPLLNPKESIDGISTSWIASCLSVLQFSSSVGHEAMLQDSSSKDFASQQLSSLIKENPKFVLVDRSRLRESAIATLVLSLAPEVGVSSQLYRDLLPPEAKDLPDDLKQEICRRRQIRWQTAINNAHVDSQESRDQLQLLESIFDGNPITELFGQISSV